jgi:hypothetical protein
MPGLNMENVHKLFSKPKYYFIFPIVVAALFSTSLIQVACPVCGGAGVLSQSVGMQDVRVVSVDSRVLDSVQDACTNYIVTSADPIIHINNVGTETAKGYLVLHLIDSKTGQTLAIQDLAIEASPNADSNLQSEVTFAYNTIDKPPADMEIQVEVYLGEVPCIACGGTGKVSLSTYLLDRSYKETFISSVLSQQDYGPGDWVVINGQNVQVGSQTWLQWMELG